MGMKRVLKQNKRISVWGSIDSRWGAPRGRASQSPTPIGSDPDMGFSEKYSPGGGGRGRGWQGSRGGSPVPCADVSERSPSFFSSSNGFNSSGSFRGRSTGAGRRGECLRGSSPGYEFTLPETSSTPVKWTSPLFLEIGTGDPFARIIDELDVREEATTIDEQREFSAFVILSLMSLAAKLKPPEDNSSLMLSLKSKLFGVLLVNAMISNDSRYLSKLVTVCRSLAKRFSEEDRSRFWRAIDGFETRDNRHCCKSLEAMCNRLIELSFATSGLFPPGWVAQFTNPELFGVGFAVGNGWRDLELLRNDAPSYFLSRFSNKEELMSKLGDLQIIRNGLVHEGTSARGLSHMFRVVKDVLTLFANGSGVSPRSDRSPTLADFPTLEETFPARSPTPLGRSKSRQGMSPVSLVVSWPSPEEMAKTWKEMEAKYPPHLLGRCTPPPADPEMRPPSTNPHLLTPKPKRMARAGSDGSCGSVEIQL